MKDNLLNDTNVQDGLKHLAKIAEERAAFDKLEATQQAAVEVSARMARRGRSSARRSA